MKKLMVAAIAIAFAAVAQAASVQWGGTFSTPDVSDTLAAGTQVALLYSATGFSGDATSIEAFTVGTAADNGGAIVALHSIDGSQSENWEFATMWANEGKDVNGSYAILVLSDDGKSATYMDMGTIEGTTATSPMQNKVYNEGWADESASLTTGGYTVSVGEAVPEPTSGLLLLIGMAGLALRRRRA